MGEEGKRSTFLESLIRKGPLWHAPSGLGATYCNLMVACSQRSSKLLRKRYMVFVWVDSRGSLLCGRFCDLSAATSCDLTPNPHNAGTGDPLSREGTLNSFCTKQYQVTSSLLGICSPRSTVRRLGSLFKTSGHAVADNYYM